MARKRSLGLWYRFYISILDDPKIEALSDANYRIWTKLNAIATKHGGIIPGAIKTLAILIRRPEGKVRDAMQVLLSAGLMERCGEDYSPHDWEQWQYDSDVSTGRVREFRERSKLANKGDETVPETPNETFHSYVDHQSTESQKEKDHQGARVLLTRICEILGVHLQDDPARITWLRQTEAMLEDGLDAPRIIAATEIARANGVVNLSYIRRVAFNPPKPQQTASPSKPTTDEIGERLKQKWNEEDEQTRSVRDGSEANEGRVLAAVAHSEIG